LEDEKEKKYTERVADARRSTHKQKKQGACRAEVKGWAEREGPLERRGARPTRLAGSAVFRCDSRAAAVRLTHAWFNGWLGSKQAHDMSSQLEQQARKQSNCTTLYSPRDWSAEYYFL